MNPITRQEMFLAAASGEGNEIPEPITREEMYLKKIAENGGGGGTGGTTNYNALSNKPQIGGIELKGNKSLADLGIPTKTSQLTNDDNVVKDASYVHTDNNYDATAKSIVDGVSAALSGKVDNSKLGAVNGVAQLGEDGKLLSSQMPGSIDHIIEAYYNVDDGKFYEEATYETEIAPQSSVIYVSLDTNKTYRWSGTQYVEISESLALGETAQTAYPGNKGKANADAINGILDGANIDSFADVETALSGKINTTSRGAANGVAGLDANGKVPTDQLPALLGLGETAQTAYAGDKGKANADAITAIKDGANIDSFADVETALSDKADKVSGATNNNFAALDASGNLKDSGKKASDFTTKTAYLGNLANNGSKNFLAMRLGVLKSKNYNGVKWDGNTYISAGMTLVCNLMPGTDIVESFTLSGTTTASTPFSFTPYCGNMNFNGKAVTVAMIADATNNNIRITANGTNYLYANTTQQKYNYTPTSNVWGSQIYVPRSVTISNPVTFKLMICLQSDYDFDPTWVAPIRNNFQLEQDIKDIHNAIAVNYAPRKDAGEYTNQGITYTVNDDGTVTLTDGEVTTTPSGLTLGKAKGLVDGKKYRLCGLPSPVGNCFIKMYSDNWANAMEISAGNLEQVFTYSKATAMDNLQVGIRVVGTAANNQVFKPMIVPIDYDGEYIPYTKNNQQLTEETEQISGKWLIESTRSSVSVTADGTKTYQTLVNELALALVERAQGLENGKIMELIGFYDDADFGYAPSSNQYNQMANNATSIACSFATATAASSSTCSFKSVTVHTTLANVYMGRMTCGNATSGNTFTNYLTVKPTSGKKMYVYYRVLKQYDNGNK